MRRPVRRLPRRQPPAPSGIRPANRSGPGWRAFAAPRAAKANSSPTSSPIFLRNSPSAPALAAPRRRSNRPRPRHAQRHHWLHKGGIVLHFSRIDSITDAETLLGLIVAIPWSSAPRSPTAKPTSLTSSAAPSSMSPAPPALIGEIEDVDRTAGPVALLVVRGKEGRNPRALRKILSPQNRRRRQARRNGPPRRPHQPEHPSPKHASPKINRS